MTNVVNAVALYSAICHQSGNPLSHPTTIQQPPRTAASTPDTAFAAASPTR
jgi:hypothetical protein